MDFPFSLFSLLTFLVLGSITSKLLELSLLAGGIKNKVLQGEREWSYPRPVLLDADF